MPVSKDEEEIHYLEIRERPYIEQLVIEKNELISLNGFCFNVILLKQGYYRILHDFFFQPIILLEHSFALGNGTQIILQKNIFIALTCIDI